MVNVGHGVTWDAPLWNGFLCLNLLRICFEWVN